MEQLPTLAEHVEAWLAVERGQVQPSTLQTYRRQLEGYALPRLGALRLDKITPRT